MLTDICESFFTKDMTSFGVSMKMNIVFEVLGESCRASDVCAECICVSEILSIIDRRRCSSCSSSGSFCHDILFSSELVDTSFSF